MSRSVKNYVDKLFASAVRELLTSCQPDVATLYTELFTLQNEWQQKSKTVATKVKYAKAVSILIEHVKYGWSFGILQRPQPQPHVNESARKDKRIRALCPLARQCGHDIAARQLAEINKRHRSHLRANQPQTSQPSHEAAIAEMP